MVDSDTVKWSTRILVKRSTRILVKWSTRILVKRSTRILVKWSTRILVDSDSDGAAGRRRGGRSAGGGRFVRGTCSAHGRPLEWRGRFGVWVLAERFDQSQMCSGQIALVKSLSSNRCRRIALVKSLRSNCSARQRPNDPRNEPTSCGRPSLSDLTRRDPVAKPPAATRLTSGDAFDQW